MKPKQPTQRKRKQRRRAKKLRHIPSEHFSVLHPDEISEAPAVAPSLSMAAGSAQHADIPIGNPTVTPSHFSDGTSQPWTDANAMAAAQPSSPEEFPAHWQQPYVFDHPTYPALTEDQDLHEWQGQMELGIRGQGPQQAVNVAGQSLSLQHNVYFVPHGSQIGIMDGLHHHAISDVYASPQQTPPNDNAASFALHQGSFNRNPQDESDNAMEGDFMTEHQSSY